MKVFVYFNLHKKLWSIKSLESGRVIGHATEVILRDCQFKVSQAGRARVIAEQRKNVHAGIVGTLEAWRGDATRAHPLHPYPCTMWDSSDAKYKKYAKSHGRAVTYNPYKMAQFQCVNTGAELTFSSMVYMGAKKVFSFNPLLIPS